jgi:hypothetical protein
MMTELCYAAPTIHLSIYLSTHLSIYLSTLSHRIVGIKVNQQRLIYAGKQLDANMTLQHYGIQPSSVIHLILRLLGVMM